MSMPVHIIGWSFNYKGPYTEIKVGASTEQEAMRIASKHISNPQAFLSYRGLLKQGVDKVSKMH